MDKTLADKRIKSATEEREVMNSVFAIAPRVWRMKDIFVNVYIILSETDNTKWILVDTGLKSSSARIKRMVAEVIEADSVPAAIILTHGHFDHRGSLMQLAEEWRVPVYCHHMELPYLTGMASYPPADPTVGGGMLAAFSFLYPRGPINIREHLKELPEDGSVPSFHEWKWIHTPGHTPGHISLFRESDGVLIAGDAFVTTRQESVFSVITQKKQISGPPKYFTPDWGSAARSVRALAALEPNVITSGHGHAIYGNEARKGLHKLARDFWQLGMPESGRYVKEPALFTEEGPIYVPVRQRKIKTFAIVAAASLLVAGFILYRGKQKKLGKSLFRSALPFIGSSIAALLG